MIENQREPVPKVVIQWEQVKSCDTMETSCDTMGTSSKVVLQWEQVVLQWEQVVLQWKPVSKVVIQWNQFQQWNLLGLKSKLEIRKLKNVS